MSTADLLKPGNDGLAEIWSSGHAGPMTDCREDDAKAGRDGRCETSRMRTGAFRSSHQSHETVLLDPQTAPQHEYRSSVNCRGHDIFARKICMKNYQNARILHDFCPKMPEFYIVIARKIYSPNFRGDTCPPCPVSYAYL